MSHIFYENRDELSFKDEHPAEAYLYGFTPSAYIFSFSAEGFSLSSGGLLVEIYMLSLTLSGAYESCSKTGHMACAIDEIKVIQKKMASVLSSQDWLTSSLEQEISGKSMVLKEIIDQISAFLLRNTAQLH